MAMVLCVPCAVEKRAEINEAVGRSGPASRDESGIIVLDLVGYREWVTPEGTPKDGVAHIFRDDLNHWDRIRQRCLACEERLSA